jgi:hypothetical protein
VPSWQSWRIELSELQAFATAFAIMARHIVRGARAIPIPRGPCAAMRRLEQAMERSCNYSALGKVLIAVPAYLAIFYWGLQYSFYKVFSQFRVSDDEGNMMLKVRAFLDHSASYDSLSGVYGPFYYLHKYAIYSLLHANVSHDLTGLTTTVLWGIIAASGAVLVHRVSRSIVLPAVAQMLLLAHLSALANEPGHPQEIALVLIFGALLLSTFVNERRGGFLMMAGLGAAGVALLLVKVNLGAYLCAPLALAVLCALPERPLVRGFTWLAVAVALVLPAAIMWRHLDMPWGRHYCALVTLVIAACLVTSWRGSKVGELRWGHVGAVAVGATLSLAGVCTVIVVQGATLSGIANSVLWRPAAFPSWFVVPTPLSGRGVTAAAVALVIAVCYALAPGKRKQHGIPQIALSVVKLAYGCCVFYTAHYYRSSLLLGAIPLPFIWLVLARPETDEKPTLHARFPRVFLCLLAAFQTLQAYPVFGSQTRWAAILVVPVAVICVGDALRTLSDAGMRRLQRYPSLRERSWRQPMLAGLVLCCVFLGYYMSTKLTEVKAVYAEQTPLDLPGAGRLRLPPSQVREIRWAVENLKSDCDGFVGLPGFASLYFWTRIPPPAIINNAWIVNLDDNAQRAVVDTMQRYQRPCVLYDASAVKYWARGRPLDAMKPLVRYILTEYKPAKSYGPYTLLWKADRSGSAQTQGSVRRKVRPLVGRLTPSPG